MAYGPNELTSGPFTSRPIQLRAEAKLLLPRTFGPVNGGPTLPKLTPVAFNTSTLKWGVWSAAGSNGMATIKGLIWPEDLILDAVNDKLHNVLMEGFAHADDIPTPAGETRSVMLEALRTQTRAINIYIEGLANYV